MDNESIRIRRVGTVTLGLTLIVFGILFILQLFVPVLDYVVILHMWPLIFIFLGVEILVSNLHFKGWQFKYDFAAIVIIALVTMFSMGMAFVDWVVVHMPAYVHWN